MKGQRILNWLLEGDAAIRYQVFRDLLNREVPAQRKEIETSGWGKAILDNRRSNGHWGQGFYAPKWISTHYTLLDLKHLGINPENPAIGETTGMVLAQDKGRDGGLNPCRTDRNSDICVTGMGLNYCSYFRAGEESLRSIIDFLLSWQMDDGGFNCCSNQKGAVHGSLHTTLSVAEGFCEYRKNAYQYRIHEIETAEAAAREFMLMHRLFKSDKTGNIISGSFLKLSYPSRWKYDILRAMEYFRDSGTLFDLRMEDAIGILLKKRRKDLTWPLQAKHPGQTHFEMELPGNPSRWNTLRALRVLKTYHQLSDEPLDITPE